MRRFIVGLAIAVLVSANVGWVQAGVYSVVDVGTLGGSWGSWALGVNNAGQVVGVSWIAGNASQHAFLYSGGALSDLGTLGGTASVASDINDSGQVAGWSRIANDAASHAFLYSSGAMSDLGTLGGTNSGSFGIGPAINNSGQVAGTSEIGGGVNHAFLYSSGVMTDIGSLGFLSYGNDINASGQVTGSSYVTGAGPVPAFIYSGGVMTSIGTLPGGTVALGNGINDSGHVVGQANITGDPNWYAFLYSGGTMTNLGTLGGTWSHAEAVNNSGQIVGQSVNSQNSQRAFIYSGSTMTDLNTLIDHTPGDNWYLQSAYDINDGGQVVGYGWHNGVQRGFLLTPQSSVVPEPSTLVTFTGLLAMGLVGGGWRRWRGRA